LRRADHSSKESYRLCKKDYETVEEVRAQQTAVEPLMNELMNDRLIMKEETNKQTNKNKSGGKRKEMRKN
jgi:hypothetical protein